MAYRVALEVLRRTGVEDGLFDLQLSSLRAEFDQGYIPEDAEPDEGTPGLYGFSVAGFAVDVHIDEKLMTLTIVRIEMATAFSRGQLVL